MYYHSFPVEFFLMVIMICGAVNFALHVEVWKGHLRDFFRDLEVKTMVIWLCAMAVVFTPILAFLFQRIVPERKLVLPYFGPAHFPVLWLRAW